MGVYYELKIIEESDSDQPDAALVKITKEQAETTTSPTVEKLSPEEFHALNLFMPNLLESFRTIHESESNFIDMYSKFIVGSYYMPSKEEYEQMPARFSFYMDKHRLIFVESCDAAEIILEKISKSGVISDITPAHCLHAFIKEMLMGDFRFLGSFEDRLEETEERIMENHAQIPSNLITRFRRKAMQLSVFYQQIAGITSELADNENKLMSDKDAHSFDHLSSIADRLTSRADTLSDYSTQLQELQQTRIDLKQNQIMQILTIVTALFAPLTLITGWFGMNLYFLPGLDWQFMWLALIIGALVSTTLLLLWFRYKKWL